MNWQPTGLTRIFHEGRYKNGGIPYGSSERVKAITKELTAVTKSDQNAIPLSSLDQRQIAASFSGGDIISNAGLLLLREIIQKNGLAKKATACLNRQVSQKTFTMFSGITGGDLFRLAAVRRQATSYVYGYCHSLRAIHTSCHSRRALAKFGIQCANTWIPDQARYGGMAYECRATNNGSFSSNAEQLSI